MMMYGLDPVYLMFALPGLLLGIWAQFKLSHTYSKYNEMQNDSGLTGAEAARTILDRAGLRDVPVEATDGHLSDHYDPARRALVLSEANFSGRTIAAVGVAAHEAGHALQHQVGYGMFNLRMQLVPITQFASYAYAGIFLAGFIFRSMFPTLILVAIGLFAILTFFQLVTLPVEFDASKRAKSELLRLGLVRGDEQHGVAKVLDAAALTYVAALVSSVLQLLYLLSMARDRR